MDNIKKWITIKDSEGILRPKAYLETEGMHVFQKLPQLEDGERFVTVEIKEVIT